MRETEVHAASGGLQANLRGLHLLSSEIRLQQQNLRQIFAGSTIQEDFEQALPANVPAPAAQSGLHSGLPVLRRGPEDAIRCRQVVRHLLLYSGDAALCPEEMLSGLEELHSGGAERTVLSLQLRLWQPAGLPAISQLPPV